MPQNYGEEDMGLAKTLAVASLCVASLLNSRPLFGRSQASQEGPQTKKAQAALEVSAEGGSQGMLLSEPLNVEDCVLIAVDHSPVGRSAHATFLGAKEAAQSAKAPYWPSAGFSAGYSRWQKHIFLPSGLGPPGQELPSLVGPTNDYSFSLNANYLLWDSGERKARLGAARAIEAASQSQEESARQDLALAVHQAFYALESSVEMLGVAKVRLRRAEDHVRIAKTRKDTGTVPLLDVLRAEVEASNARLALVGAEGSVRISRGKLATTMGLPVETPLVITVSEAPVSQPDELGLSVALDRSILFRSAVKVAEQRVVAAERGVASARSAWGPKVNAITSYGREDAGWWPHDKTWSAGLVISIPVFTGFSRVHDVARAKAEMAKSQADLEQVKLEVRQEVWSAFSSLQESYESVEASQVLVQSAEESLRLARERYEVGAGTITDLLDSENSLAAAGGSLVTARSNLRTAYARYRWSTGDLLLVGASGE